LAELGSLAGGLAGAVSSSAGANPPTDARSKTTSPIRESLKQRHDAL